MASTPLPPPLDEMRACADGIVRWLVERGYAAERCTAEDALWKLDHVKINDSEQASLLRTTFAWLWCSALPVFDGRRDKAAVDAAALEPSADVPDPATFAELHFGQSEHLIAGKLRKVVAAAEELEPLLRRVEERQMARTAFRWRPMAQLFRAWVGMGRWLLRLIEPTQYRLGVPHTLDDWRSSRTAIELELHSAGFSDEVIDRVLPMGGGQRKVAQRRYRARLKLTPNPQFHV